MILWLDFLGHTLAWFPGHTSAWFIGHTLAWFLGQTLAWFFWLDFFAIPWLDFLDLISWTWFLWLDFFGLISLAWFLWLDFLGILWLDFFGLISLTWFLGHTGAWYTAVSRKRAHGWGTLQVCQRGGWALFWLFLHLTTKQRPRHVYSDSKPSKQIIAHKITYKESPLWMAWCDGEHSVACGANHIIYFLLHKDALY